jgi:hypothetical protein
MSFSSLSDGHAVSVGMREACSAQCESEHQK